MSSSASRQRRGAGRVLWGRVGATLLALLLMFVLGRCTADSGIPQAEYDASQARVSELEQRTRDLEEAQVALAAGGIDRTPAPSPGAEPEQTEAAEPSSDASPQAGGTTYTVQDGDTLESIAEQFYGDRARFGLIQQANSGVDSTTLQVGQELRIPPPP